MFLLRLLTRPARTFTFFVAEWAARCFVSLILSFNKFEMNRPLPRIYTDGTHGQVPRALLA